jgi:hypothetical protein
LKKFTRQQRFSELEQDRAVGRVMHSRRQGKLLYDVKAQVTTLENSAFVRVSNGYYWRTKGEKKYKNTVAQQGCHG